VVEDPVALATDFEALEPGCAVVVRTGTLVPFTGATQ